MRATSDKKEKFNPVSITITMESEAEMNQFYSIFNQTRIRDVTPDIGDDLIRKAIEDANGGMPNYNEAFDVISGILRNRELTG